MIRREVLRFTDEMERVLKKNDYKGGWQDCDINYLRFRLSVLLNLAAKPLI